MIDDDAFMDDSVLDSLIQARRITRGNRGGAFDLITRSPLAPVNHKINLHSGLRPIEVVLATSMHQVFGRNQLFNDKPFPTAPAGRRGKQPFPRT